MDFEVGVREFIAYLARQNPHVLRDTRRPKTTVEQYYPELKSVVIEKEIKNYRDKTAGRLAYVCCPYNVLFNAEDFLKNCFYAEPCVVRNGVILGIYGGIMVEDPDRNVPPQFKMLLLSEEMKKEMRENMRPRYRRLGFTVA